LERIKGLKVKKDGIDEEINTKKNIPRLENRPLNSKSVANWFTSKAEKTLINSADIIRR
jgi:hypothetical protein